MIELRHLGLRHFVIAKCRHLAKLIIYFYASGLTGIVAA